MLLLNQISCCLFQSDITMSYHIQYCNEAEGMCSATPSQAAPLEEAATAVGCISHMAGHEINNLDAVPERQSEACDTCIALSDQKSAVLPPVLCAVVLDQSLGHLPAVFHVTMKPSLWTELFLVLTKTRTTSSHSTQIFTQHRFSHL